MSSGLGLPTGQPIFRSMCGRVRLSSDVSEIKLVFSIPRHRPTPNFPPHWLALKTVELPDDSNSCVIAPTAAFSSMRTRAPANAREILGPQKRRARRSRLSPALGATVQRQPSGVAGAAAGVGRTAFYGARDRLLKQGRVQQDGSAISSSSPISPPVRKRTKKQPNEPWLNWYGKLVRETPLKGSGLPEPPCRRK